MRSCKLLCLFLAAVLVGSPLYPRAATPGEELPRVLMGEDVQTWADETLPAMAGEGGEWYAIALTQGDFSVDLTEYAVALTAYFFSHRDDNPVERQRCALALAAMGIREYAGQTAEETIGKQGIMSLIFGLHLLQNGGESSLLTPQGVAEQLVSLQLPDGGWALSGQYGDVDVTAMALQALALQKDAWTEAIRKGLAFLETKQLASGGFKSYGVENSESVSQVIIALTALGIDPGTDQRFAGIIEAWESFRREDGTFAHVLGGEANGHANAQALLAYVAMERQKRGAEGLYAFSTEEAEPPQVSLPPENPSGEHSEEAQSREASHAGSAEDEEMSPTRRVVLWVCILLAVASGVYLLLPGKKR